ncbi:MAG: hypothetical protein N2255_03270 [Kiritimatiellae bacterium]|nr:hypothetical protein [Kiritimatiellia bacterium]
MKLTRLVALVAGILTCSGKHTLAQTFSTGPRISFSPTGIRITFAVDRPTDVELSIVRADGSVVRHLAAGYLGGSIPPPPPLVPGLAQQVEWDLRDNAGRLVLDTSRLRLRVRAGMFVRYGGTIGHPAVLESKIYGLATDTNGHLYVASGGGYGDNLFTIKVFNRSGSYLRTIMPYPANLPLSEVVGFGSQTLRDGKLNPPQYNALLPWIYQYAVGGLMGNVIRNGVLWLTNNRGYICRIRSSNGGCISWGTAGTAPAPPAQGPICWALSPDGQRLYLAGWYRKGSVADGQIFRVDPTTGTRTTFVQIDVPPDSFWLVEPNGWYDYTNWGRKNGMSAIHGLAVDAQGRVYACDRVNQRLAVYASDGTLLGFTPVQWPDLVALSTTGPEIYVTTRRVIDGYTARNEIKVIKLSGWNNGTVLAELTLNGVNAPSMAVDTTASPAVIWLSNIGTDGSSLVRIEDRGTTLVVTGRLNEGLPAMPGAVVKVWADPFTDDVVVNDGWNGLNRFHGITGESRSFPLKGIDMAFGPDGNIYVYGQAGWHELVAKFNRSFQPVPFAATGNNKTTLTTTGKDVYGRYGHGWCNKGLYVASSGRIYVYNMYDWNKYFINVWDADGRAEQHTRVGDGLIGPLDPEGGGVCVDRAGNIYVGLHGFPSSSPYTTRTMGTVVKFVPQGGGYVAAPSGQPGIPWKFSAVGSYVEGGVTAYPRCAPQVATGCVCKEARFDLDEYGRLYIPNALDYYVAVTDNSGNEILKFGYYGNPDSFGPGSPVPDPAIALGWPIAVSAGQADKGRLFVADTLNHRVVRVDVSYRAEYMGPVVPQGTIFAVR